MEPTLNRNINRNLVTNTIRNRQNSRLGGSNSLLRTAQRDISDGIRASIVFGGFVDVDLSAGFVFNLVDGCTGFTEYAGDGANGDGEL